MLRQIYSALPSGVRSGIKRVLGAQGHQRSLFDVVKAMHVANGKKRLDHAARQMAWHLKLAGISSLQGKSCLELGAGYVLAEPIIFYLLGSRVAAATDYNRIASSRATLRSVRRSKPQDVAAALSGFDLPPDFDQRLIRVFSADSAALHALFSYWAPYDGASQDTLGHFDLIHSVSVMEHIPATSSRRSCATSRDN